MARLRARDLEALGDLYRELGGAMTTLARSLLRDADDADDVVEQALLRVRDAIEGLRDPRALRAWTLRIVTRLCRDRQRQQRRLAGPPEAHDPLEHAGLRIDPVAEIDAGIDRARVLAAIERALRRLPAPQREVVVLRDRMTLSGAEAAAVLGIREGALRVRLLRARQALRRELGREWREGPA